MLLTTKHRSSFMYCPFFVLPCTFEDATVRPGRHSSECHLEASGRHYSMHVTNKYRSRPNIHRSPNCPCSGRPSRRSYAENAALLPTRLYDSSTGGCIPTSLCNMHSMEGGDQAPARDHQEALCTSRSREVGTIEGGESI
jgi:hypothetical protein